MVYYQNVRGLRTKLDDLKFAILCSAVQYDILVFVETWLNSSISSSELGLTNFNIFRSDRSSSTSSFSRGGGVLIAIRNSLSCSLITPIRDDLEQVFVRVRLHNKYVIFGALYLPPASQPDLYDRHVCCVSEIFHNYSDDAFCILGDFNLPHVVWPTGPGSFCSKKPGIPSLESSAIDLLLEGYSYCGLAQVNSIGNSFGSLLDLIFVKDIELSVDNAVDFLISPDAYHPPLKVRLNDQFAFTNQNRDNVTYVDFKCGDFPRIINHLNSIDWDSVTRGVDPDIAVDRLYSHIDEVIAAYVPVRVYRRSFYPRWFSPRLRSLISYKKRAHKAFKTSNSLADYLVFSDLRSQCKSLTKCDYRAYVGTVENSMQYNIRNFWSFVNAKRGDHGLPSSMHYEGSTASSFIAIADLFAAYFGSVYASPSVRSTALDLQHTSFNNVNLKDLTISIGDIFSKLNCLDSSKGPGADGIPPLFFKQCSFILSRPLWNIFNTSLASGVFPLRWKSSLVTPVFKTGDRSDVRNYRPISKLSVLPKVFEEIVTDMLSSLLTSSLCVEQHGFVPKRSTATNLAVYHSFVSRALDEGLQVDTVYTDFQKAFDTVDHTVLLHKLLSWGFCGPLLTWLESYLSDRVQIVKVSNSLSLLINVTSGVPQGSHLGPLLFNVFINDIVDVLTDANFLLYADDLKVFRVIRGVEDANCMQEDLLRLERWCTANRMRLHLGKCVVLRASRARFCMKYPYKLNNVELGEVSEVIDLGVCITPCFDFRPHYLRCTSKAMRALGFISRFARHFRNSESLKLLYFALVRPHVEYASIIWSPKHTKFIKSIERVQHKFLRFASRILGNPMDWNDHDYDPVLVSLRMVTLQERRCFADFIFLYKVIRGHIDCPDLLALVAFNAPVRGMRSRPLFVARVPKYRHYTVDPINRAMIIANCNFNGIDPFQCSLTSVRTILYRTVTNLHRDI